MPELESIKVATEATGLNSLELLFDYTKFHIGLYLTLAGAYMSSFFSMRQNRRNK